MIFMTLPLKSPFSPMEALSVDRIPRGNDWLYEPKWDGFRCLVFRDGPKVELQSKSGRPLTRYFPEIVAAIVGVKAKAFVLDGEIVVPRGKVFSFDDLLQRIHPAESRVNRLSTDTPALLIVFDLLVDQNGRSLITQALRERSKDLQKFDGKFLRSKKIIRLSPATGKLADAQKWLKQAGATIDGIIAKRADLPYQSGNRLGMQKIKNFRSADCVVGGFRYNEGKKMVGSLLLGLYDDEDLLNHVGFTSSIRTTDKKTLTKKLEKLIAPPGFTGTKPGGPSRWSTSRSNEWQPLRPKLVVEVSYDHFSGDRFRHGTRLLRFRPDKSPQECRTDQVKQKQASVINLLRQSNKFR
jgi:ATP-dependent DNA ligase